MAKKTKAIVKSQGSEHHDEEEEEPLPKIMYTRPPPLPFKCPNFVVFDLNGTPSAVRLSWRRAILYLRLWCFNNTDKRYQFGDSRCSSCMIPDAGKFFIYMNWKADWLCAVIDGPSLYLDGYVTRSFGKEGDIKARENDKTNWVGPVLIEKSEALPWPGNYKRAHTCKLGYNGIVPSVKGMFVYVDTGKCKSTQMVEEYGETIILHFPEAARSQELYEDIDRSFLEGDKLGMTRLKAARRWSKECEEATSNMQYTTVLEYAEKSGAKMESYFGKSTKIIENFRLMYRPNTNPIHAKLLLTDLPVQLGMSGPVGAVWAMQQEIDSNMPSFMFLIKRFSLNSETNIGSSSIGKLDREIALEKTRNIVRSKSTKALREKRPISAEREHDPHMQQIHNVGLYNLGETCYMNSTIQCMRSVPELVDALASYARNDRRDWIEPASHELTVATHDTLSMLDRSTTPICPSKLIETLREIHPVFAEQERGSYKQQDAEECWSVLVDTFSETLASQESEPTALDRMKEIFGITLSSFAGTGECLTQSMKLIRCPINDGVKHLHELLGQSLKMGHSFCEKDSKINELPRYFTIQLGRMCHDDKLNTRVKNFDKVNHSLHMDLYEYCSDELKLKLQPHREVLESAAALGSSSMDIDQVDRIVPKKQLTGIYNLLAIVTHKGPTPNGGHYVAWVKKANGMWVQFSDKYVSTHDDNEILELTGGSDDQHVPYIYLYKAELI